MSDNSERMRVIRERLTEAFAPTSLDIIDDSHKHAGHAGARHGGHFQVDIVADAFEGKTPVQRHRMIYQALGDYMQTDVHALAIRARTPSE